MSSCGLQGERRDCIARELPFLERIRLLDNGSVCSCWLRRWFPHNAVVVQRSVSTQLFERDSEEASPHGLPKSRSRDGPCGA
jgi:hypothetical protein